VTLLPAKKRRYKKSGPEKMRLVLGFKLRFKKKNIIIIIIIMDIYIYIYI